jgi:hypothetical protein
MSLIGELARRGIALTANIIELGREIYGREYRLPPHALDEDISDWAGPDDMWPEDPVIADTASEPELLVISQWGLKLPSGEMAWNSWWGVQFGDPLNRMLMVAKLQRTGLDLGFAETQLGKFLCHYSWATRNQIATVVYEDTGAYPLTHPEVSAQPPGEQGLQQNENESEDGPQPAVRDDPDPGVHRRPLGGDEG